MKITLVDDDTIFFDNGNRITWTHYQECYENTYADFSQLEEMAKNVDFDENLDFEMVGEVGFRFGNKNGYMFFIPCYSYQNGYYSSDVEICYHTKDGNRKYEVTGELHLN